MCELADLVAGRANAPSIQSEGPVTSAGGFVMAIAGSLRRKIGHSGQCLRSDFA